MQNVIDSITDKLNQFTTAIEAARAGSPVPAAEAALRKARAAVEDLAAEDESISPAELVKRRRSAADAVEVAEISLERAKRADQSTVSKPWPLFAVAKAECAKALRDAGDKYAPEFKSRLIDLIGQQEFDMDVARFGNLVFRRSDRFYHAARSIEATKDPEHGATEFAAAFELIESVNR